jgi:hypothetical protein
MKRWTIVAGLALVLPSYLFVSANLLNEARVPFLYDSLEGVMQMMGSPVVILGGLLGALALNL